MFVNSIECLVRNGYQIHVISSGEISVYFAFDSQALQQEVWNRDAELICAFIGERKITAYYTFGMNQVPAPFPLATDAEPVVAEEPVAELVTEPFDQPVAEPVAEPVFKPDLELCLQPPTQSLDFLEVLSGAGDEYIIYAKIDNTFHIHWKVSRKVAKEVWRRDRSHICQWLGADTLNTVSWEEPVADTKASKWKQVSPEETKPITVLRQVVAFGKPVADLAILEDGSHHVYFYLPRQETKQIYPNIKGEFTGYEVTSVSFES